MTDINVVQDWEVWQICLKPNNLLVHILILLQLFFHSRLLSIRYKSVKMIYGGERMVHTDTDILGNVVKQARQKSDMTIEKLAELVVVTARYIYRIENEGKKPSFEVLHKIIQVLHIDPDLIFYPRKPTKDSEIEDLLRMLYNCDERSLEVVKATAKALIGTTLEK